MEKEKAEKYCASCIEIGGFFIVFITKLQMLYCNWKVAVLCYSQVVGNVTDNDTDNDTKSKK